jgi:hypothetical protein
MQSKAPGPRRRPAPDDLSIVVLPLKKKKDCRAEVNQRLIVSRSFYLKLESFFSVKPLVTTNLTTLQAFHFCFDNATAHASLV